MRNFAVLTLAAMLACTLAGATTRPEKPDVATTANTRASSTVGGPMAGYDSALAERLGADQRGMRRYVLVILKTGPNRMPEGEKRKAMFAGHFANIQRLADEGKLALAGPFEDNPNGWRGLFVFAVSDIGEAQRLTATDPVIANGEMVAEFHPWYGSAAVMMIPEIHKRIAMPTK